MSVRAIITLFLLIIITTTAVRSGAQQTLTGTAGASGDSVRPSLVVTSGPTSRPEFGRNTLAMATGALGAAVAVSLFDSRLLDGTRRLGNRAEMDRGSAFGSMIGGPGPIALGVTMYAAGRITGDGFIASTGREVVRAVLVSGGLTAVLKGAVGRTRPFASPGDADEYNPGHGFLNSVRGSFPSGHTSAAFAAATVLIREMDVAHPHARPIAVPLLLGSASFVGLSRVYDRQHWPSDVVVGAAIGSITGYEVVAHAHGDRSRIDLGLLSHLVMSPQKSGMQLGWSLR